MLKRARQAIIREMARLQSGHAWVPPDINAVPDCPEGQVVGAPDFVGVGVQKGGTSWWFSLLASHPSVHHDHALPKERHFFTDAWGREAPSADLYARWFPRPPDKITGEWTPRYMHDPWTLPLLAQAAPEARILVLFRDPLQRLISALGHYEARRARMTPDLVHDAIGRGLYHPQLKRVYEVFPAEHVLVLQYEQCLQDFAGQWARTLRFLDLEGFEPVLPTERVNAARGTKPKLPAHLVTQVRALYRADCAALLGDGVAIDRRLWSSCD